ncbi:MAG: carbon starvation protein A [Planctomycetaceae bacterium]|nr:MAG: carbon starvation protein A [Planctomycetaceae bacterium]
MSTLITVLLSFFGFIVAYHTYGRWVSRKLFRVDADAVVPAHELRDDIDFVPTERSVIFGHHFTSIAGTGPIVGPAIAVFWGWLPALLWVVFGSILIGAVHDMSALIISLRSRGETIGQSAGRLISPRARLIFLVVLALALSVVLGIFGLVIANIFALYPESVLSVWVAMPVAIFIGWWHHRRGRGLLLPSAIGLAILYLGVYVGAYYLPLDIARILPAESLWLTPVVVWTVILLVYAALASVLPVWLLLQPRDYINSYQLYVALGLLVLGVFAASLSGSADLMASAPAIARDVPSDAPPILPFLFITIACGACSGFHCLVSSGTTSKQLNSESDAQVVGYGGMLMEGALAVIVIVACCAGVGMGRIDRSVGSGGITQYSQVTTEAGQQRAAWTAYYRPTGPDGSPGQWKDHKLQRQLGAFIDGGANFLTAIGMPLKLGIAIMAVLVACFAATTLDTAARLNRYVLQELASSLRIRPLENRFAATLAAVGVAGAIALLAGEKPGTGGLILWPLFGATNQLLAGLALMVATFYLARRSRGVAVVALPMLLMLVMPAWAMTYDLFNNWIPQRNYTLIAFGFTILGLQGWMVFEGLSVYRRIRGVEEAAAQVPPGVAARAAMRAAQQRLATNASS